MAESSVQPSVSNVKATDGEVTRVGLRFGVGVGLVCAGWMLFLYLSGNNAFGPKQILAQLLVPLAAVASQWVLRRKLKPEKPGLGRALRVGALTVLVAAVISSLSLIGLAAIAGEQALDLNRAEMLEIVRAQQRENPKVKRSEQKMQQQIRNVGNITSRELAGGNFTQIMLLGLVLAIPAGIFLRE
ncbi:DUF4199 domain-containing protein [Hymenobacter lapidarius]|nr:DUF4199 domain-containing protein [Hymenobacter lapidarius]